MDEPFRIGARSSNMETPVTNLLKAGTVLAAGAFVVLLPSLAANAQSGGASVRQACRAQVRSIDPVGYDGGDLNRDRRRLFSACVRNGGRIPG
jgi:hypothetical protein